MYQRCLTTIVQCLTIALCFPIFTTSQLFFKEFLKLRKLNRGIFTLCATNQLLDTHIDFDTSWISYYNLKNMDSDGATFTYHLRQSPIGIYLNLECDNITNFLHVSSQLQVYNSSYFWLFTSSNFTSAKVALNNLEIHIDAEITLGIIHSNCSSIILYDIYKVCGSCPLIAAKEGSWVKSKLISNADFVTSKIVRRKNFFGIQLKGGIALPHYSSNQSYNSMINFLESTPRMNTDIMARKNYRIINMLTEIYNFSLLLIPTTHWGTKDNNTWNGVAGLNYYKKTNFSVSPLRITKDRLEFLDYLPFTHVFRIAFVFRHPRNLYLRNVFLRPFHENAWFAIVACIIALVVLFKCFMTFDKNVQHDYSPTDLILTVIGALLQQDTTKLFHLSSSRLLFCVALLLAFLLFQFYSAFLVGSLLSDSPKTIDSPSKLFDSHLQIGMENVAYNYELLNTKKAKRFFDKRIIANPKKQNILPLKEGLERIQIGGFAFHVEIPDAYRFLAPKLSQTEFCQLQAISLFQPLHIGTTLPKKSPFKGFFFNQILRMHEFGILDYQNKLWEPEIPKCPLDEKLDLLAVDFEHIFPLLIMLIGSILLSLTILVVEKFVARFQN